MKLFAIVLLVCPLMAQVQPGTVAPDMSFEVSTAAPAFGLAGTPPARVTHPIPPPVTERIEHDGRNLYRWSVVAVVAANALDVASSWQQMEANPVLGANSRFGARAVAIKAGFAGGSLLIEHWALRKNPKLYRKFAWLNFSVAGGLGVTASYNFHLH